MTVPPQNAVYALLALSLLGMLVSAAFFVASTNNVLMLQQV